MKTTTALKANLEQEFLNLHSYDCPCLVFLQVQHATDAFASWVKNQTL